MIDCSACTRRCKKALKLALFLATSAALVTLKDGRVACAYRDGHGCFNDLSSLSKRPATGSMDS